MLQVSNRLASGQTIRIACLGAAALLTLTFIWLLTDVPRSIHRYYQQDDALKHAPLPHEPLGGIQTSKFTPACGDKDRSENPLTSLVSKYAHLRDDKFTIALSTHERPKELGETLSILTGTEIPSLLEIVIVWNNFGQTPPENYKTEYGVEVRYRVPSEDSLNSKLQPDPDYKTKAVLLTDDDVYYAPEDLEFVFQTWRKFGEFRLVGALPRCIDADPQGKYVYNQCKDMGRDYAMILTNLCFSHIGFLDYYWSDAPEMVKMRAYVDEHFNCEDIALNYVASALTGMGPLQANGYEHFHNLGLKAGISAKAGHLEARSQCLNDFQDIMGCQPLVGQSFYIVRGNGAGDRVHSGVWAYIGVLVCLAMRAMF